MHHEWYRWRNCWYYLNTCGGTLQQNHFHCSKWIFNQYYIRRSYLAMIILLQVKKQTHSLIFILPRKLSYFEKKNVQCSTHWSSLINQNFTFCHWWITIFFKLNKILKKHWIRRRSCWRRSVRKLGTTKRYWGNLLKLIFLSKTYLPISSNRNHMANLLIRKHVMGHLEYYQVFKVGNKVSHHQEKIISRAYLLFNIILKLAEYHFKIFNYLN